MVANTVSAEEGALRKGALAVSTAAQEIQRRSSAVRTEGDNLRAIWQGDAALQYTALIDSWVTKANQLVTSLRTLESGLAATDQSLAATEEEHSATISRLNVSGILG
jgi:WXG100 family type VII secretion target